MKTLRIREFGKPTTAPELVDAEDPQAGPGGLVVALEAAPVNPSDLLLIRGWYGHRPALPAVLGTEGVGRIAAVGEGVDPARVGERVLVLPTLKHGTWQDRVAVGQDDVVPVDAHGDALQLAMLGVNPVTADLLLRHFVDLRPGAWVGQVGGGSAVGRCVIALARTRGVRTLSVVRRAEAVAELRELGGDAVVVDGPDLEEQVAAALGGEELSLVLDPVAGQAAGRLASRLFRGGTLVSYGGMSGQAVSVAPADLIFRDLQVRGFWQKHWLDAASPADVTSVYARLAPLVSHGALRVPVAATYPLDDHRAALAHATDAGRSGKVLFAW